MSKPTEFPRIRTQQDFRERVLKACESINLNYSTVVTRLLERWLAGEVSLGMELDRQFIEAAEAAVNSPRGQKALQNFSRHYDPKKNYLDATKI